jgi:hypothetical protein
MTLSFRRCAIKNGGGRRHKPQQKSKYKNAVKAVYGEGTVFSKI